MLKLKSSLLYVNCVYVNGDTAIFVKRCKYLLIQIMKYGESNAMGSALNTWQMPASPVSP